MSSRKKVIFYLDKDLHKALLAKAKEEEVPLSDMINQILADTLSEYIEDLDGQSELAEQIKANDTGVPVDLSQIVLSTLKGEEHRDNGRVNIAAGHAIIYDLQGKIRSKGVLKNLSPGGAGLEVEPLEILPQSKVIVDLGAQGLQLGPITCLVQWVATLEGHPKKNKIIGLKFEDLTVKSKEKLELYIEELRKIAGTVF